MSIKLQVLKGDITQEDVDAIVNAAHEGLTGGVDGAIHAAAGPQLLGECLNLHGCPIGQARITSGYELKARYVLHTVGPTWRGGKYNEAEDLSNCYRHCLMFAHLQGLHSISFPCLSTGAFVFPKELASVVAVGAVKDFLNWIPQTNLELIRFVCFDEENYRHYLSIIPTGEDDFEPKPTATP